MINCFFFLYFQVNKHYNALCTRDALWSWRAAKNGFVKSVEHENWLSNVKAAVTGTLHVAPLDSFTSLHFTGDMTIVDPYVLGPFASLLPWTCCLPNILFSWSFYFGKICLLKVTSRL